MTPDEEKTLQLLLKKQEEEQAASGNVFKLIHGEKKSDTQAVSMLKALVQKIESGTHPQFAIVAIRPGNGADISDEFQMCFSNYPRATPSQICGAHLLARTLENTLLPR